MTTTSANLDALSASAEKAAFGFPAWTAIDTATAAALSAKTAAKARQQHCLTHLTLSFSTAPSSALTLTVKDGTTVIWQVEISTSTLVFTENFETRPLHASTNADLTVNVGSAGGSVVQTISTAGFSIMSP